jgi:glycosyltransferase involved in cell wall biosynthesis
MRKIPRVLSLPFILRKYDCVVFLSQRRDFRRFFDHKVARFIRHPKIKVIPNGTNPNPERGTVAMFKENHHLGKGVLLLCVANFSPRKNQALAIRAFRRAAIPDSALVLIGSEFNEYSKYLMKLDTDLQSQFPEGKVVFIEKMDRISTMTAYAACDIFILTALAETQPISILESMAAGMPYISTDTGCVRDMPGGIIADDEKSLTEAIRNLHQNRKERERLGCLGRQAVMETYSNDKVIAAHHETINVILGFYSPTF